MNLPEFWDHPLTHRAGWVLLHSLWQGAFVAVLFGLLRFALRRASTQARYLAACFSLLLLAAAPAITFLLIRTAMTPSEIAGTVGDPGIGPAIVATHNAAPNVGDRASQFVFQSAKFLEQIVPWLAAAWLAGVVLCSIRWIQGCRQVKSLKTRGTGPVDPGWVDMLEDLKRRLNISRPVQLLKSAFVEVPTMIGWLRPVILLPASSLTGLTPSQLEAILAHELAHIYRNDYLVNAFQNLVETLMFYHPAVWWISRCIREEREHCCDDLAVKICGNRVGYARALAAMEELRGATTPYAFAATGGSLLQRVRRLLGLPEEGGISSGRKAGGLALLGIGILLATAGVALLLVPARYQATARIRIDGDQANPSEAFDVKARPDSDARSFQTAVAIVRSPMILNRVIQNLSLRGQWGKRYGVGGEFSGEATLKLLQQRTHAHLVPGTSLVDIQASSEDPAEAAAIANEIARLYRENEIQRASDGIEQRVRALEEQFAEQGKKVREAQAKVDRLRTELQITNPDDPTLTPNLTLSAETLKLLQNQYTTLKHEEVQQATQLQHLQKLTREELREAIQIAFQPDSALATLINELDLADQRVRFLEKDYVEQSPVYQNAQKARADLDEKINRRITGILLGLQNRLDATRARLENLGKRLESAKTNDLLVTEKSRPYIEAKRQLEDLLQFKTILGMKLAAMETDLRLPKSALVVIVDNAVAPSQPAYPDRSMATGLIAFGALSGIAGLVVLKGKRAPQLSLRPA